MSMLKFWLPVFGFLELEFVFPFILLPTQQANRKLPNLAKIKKFRGVRMTPSTQLSGSLMIKVKKLWLKATKKTVVKSYEYIRKL